MQKQLENEVAIYNELIKRIQAHNEQGTALEQERLMRLGRIQCLQEMKSSEEKDEAMTGEKIEKPQAASASESV